MIYLKTFNESNTEEVWKKIPIEGFNYEASNLGRIRNSKGQVVSPFIKKRSKNALVISLHNKDREKKFLVHQLIAKTFLEGKGSVIHIDGNRANNRVDNLRYESNPSKYSHKFVEPRRGYDAHDSYTIHQYDLRGNLVKTHGSIGEASRETGVPTTNISKAAKGKRNTAGGFVWVYDESVDTQYKGLSPEIVKEMRDYYAMNNVSFGDVWRKFKATSDSYGTSRIIQGYVYRSDMYVSDRANEIINYLREKGKNDDQIKEIMRDKYRYFIVNI